MEQDRDQKTALILALESRLYRHAQLLLQHLLPDTTENEGRL